MKLSEFFEDATGGGSMSRLIACAACGVVLAIWSVNSYRAKVMLDIPQGPLYLCLGAIAGKVMQRATGEKVEPPAPEPKV